MKNRICIFRKHQSAYNTIIVIALHSLVLLISPETGYALGYWDAIYEIGYNSKTNRIENKAACKQIVEWIAFMSAVNAKPALEETLDREIQEFNSIVPPLDVGSLYDALEYSDGIGLWHGVGIRGEITEGHYTLKSVDPDISNWIDSFSQHIPACWGSQKTFGDFGFRTFIRPSSTNSYRLKTKADMYIDDLNLSNISRIVEQFLNVVWLQSKTRKKLPGDLLGDVDLNIESQWLMYGFTNEFPHLFKLFNQYFTVENIISENSTNSIGQITYDIQVRINIEAVKIDYPHLGAQLLHLKSISNYQLMLLDAKNHPIINVGFDGAKFKLRLRFKTGRGRFNVLTEDPGKEHDGGISITKKGLQKFFINQDLMVNMAGLKIDVKALKVSLTYYKDHRTASIKCEIRQTPKEISAEGLVMGILPVWLIDLFIPSTIEDMTQAFFRTLITGNEGKGSYLMLGGIPEESLTGSSWLISDAEIMSNGIIRLAFNIQRKMFSDKDQFLEETNELSRRLWNAFFLDYQDFKMVTPSETLP